MGLSREAILFGLIMFLISGFGSLKSQMLEKSSGLEAFGGLQKDYAPVIWEGSAKIREMLLEKRPSFKPDWIPIQRP